MCDNMRRRGFQGHGDFRQGADRFPEKFLDLPNGIPDSDTFHRLFERLNPTALANCLYEWLSVQREGRQIVAIDGKTIRGSGSAAQNARHVVSAFVTNNQIVLGELATEEKSNEITAVPKLLDTIDVENAIYKRVSCRKMMFMAALNEEKLLETLLS